MALNFSAYGSGGFRPLASDAYSALLARLPQYADEAMRLRRRKTEADISETEAGIDERGRRRQMEEHALVDAEAERRQARKDAETARVGGQQQELADRLAHAQEVGQVAGRYGGDVFAAQKAASARFSRGRRGVPTIY
jgi:hypothetical protein